MQKYLIHTLNTIEIMEIKDIVRFESCQNYTKVHLDSGGFILSTHRLYEIAENLPNYFIQCHKSHIVNLNKVTRYHKSGNMELNSGDLIPVARRRKVELEKELFDWIQQVNMKNYEEEFVFANASA